LARERKKRKIQGKSALFYHSMCDIRTVFRQRGINEMLLVEGDLPAAPSKMRKRLRINRKPQPFPEECLFRWPLLEPLLRCTK
jgi:hypothetical protein